MKIEAKKYKYNLKKNSGDRPAQPISTPRVPEKSAAEKPRISLPKIRIPKIKVPRIGLPSVAMPDLTISRFKAPKIRGKRVYVAALLAGVPLAFLAVWLGMNLVHRPVQKPLFTERDLPAPPPAESNGYAAVYDDRVTDEYSRKDISDINMFRNASSMEAFLDAARGEYTMARTLADRDDVKKMIGLYREMMKKPVFADMNMPRDGDVQKVRAYVALHNSVTAAVVARLQEKKPAAAFAMMRDQLSFGMQFMRSARSMHNYLAGAQAYEKSLDILKSMLALSGGSMGFESLNACREAAAMMRSFNPKAISLAPVVAFEYVMMWRRTFDPSVQRPESSVLHQIKFRRLAFFDRGATQKLYDDRWREMHRYAKNPDDRAFAELMKSRDTRYASGRFWWFHNAVGKKYLDSVPISVYQLFPESRNRGETIARKQGEIIAVIDALKEEAKPVKKAAKKGVRPAKKQVRKKKAQ